MPENQSTKIGLSGCVTNGEGTKSCINGYLFQHNDLESSVEEADGQFVSHIGQIFMTGIMTTVVCS